MGSLVIVALPEEDDRVNKISSEKAPHLTLLYLGDVDQVDNVDQIVQFVEHAVTLSEHGKFYLDVDKRGTLGDDDADVIFFNKRSWNLKWIKQFRGQLLQNQAVRTAYDGADQHDNSVQEWIPHLTLGYPKSPAKPYDDKDAYPLYSVAFDRIAVWTDEFDGPEFELEWPDREEYEGDLAIAYSDAEKAGLMHYGVKGMKWGQRKATDPAIADVPKATRKAASKDAEEFTKAKLFYGEGAGTRRKLIKAKVEAEKKKDPQYAKAFDHFVSQTDQSKRSAGAKKERKRADRKKFVKKTAKGVGHITRGNNQYANTAAVATVAGASYLYKKNQQNAQHSEADVIDFLAHYGIKGMRWGVRNRRGEPVAISPRATSRVPHGNKRKTKIKAEGGQNHPATEDAIKVAESKAKLKKSGPAALTNRELQDLANRVQLEERVNILTSSKGQRFVREQLRNEGQNLVKKGAKKGIKKAATAALA